MTKVSHSCAGAFGLIVALFAASQSSAHSLVAAAEPGSAIERSTTGTFDDRVAMGKAAEQRPENKSYASELDRMVGNHFAQTMQSCFAAIREPQTEPFVLVADITSEGKAKAIEVRPATNIARCFATGFALAPFPTPPPYPCCEAYPVTIEMRIKE